MATTWIDLTDAIAWRGHHTGIQRVVYHLAKEFERAGNTRFFVHQSRSHRFVAAELSELPVPAAARRQPEPNRAADWRESAGRSLTGAYHRIPAGVRRQVGPAVKPVALQALAASRTAAGTARRWVSDPPTPGKRRLPVVFTPDDTVLVLGAGWFRPGLLTDLGPLKAETGFRVGHFVHDLIPVMAPHLFGPGHFELIAGYTMDVVTLADLVLVNSQSTRRDLQRFCVDINAPMVAVEVVRLADSLDTVDDPVPPAAAPPPGFLLSVGTVENRKNHVLLYAAYRLARERGIELPPLVIAGRPGWNTADLRYTLAHDPAVAGLITLLPDIDDHELAWLYRNCRFTLYPSIYEGWGMPVAESLVAGKLCLTTDVSSLPEVAGSLIDYFSPFDGGECLRAIVRYLDDEVLAAKEDEIRTTYRVQTWTDTYRQVAAALALPVPTAG